MHAHARGRPELGIWFEPAEDVVARGVSIVVDDAVRAAADRLLFGEIVVRAGLFNIPGFQQRDSVVRRRDPLPSETAVLPRRACIVEAEFRGVIQSSRSVSYGGRGLSGRETTKPNGDASPCQTDQGR